MTFAPGKVQLDGQSGRWHRDLQIDLARLRETYKTDVLVSLVEDHELADLKIGRLREEASQAGIMVVRFPIPDVSVPASMEATQFLVASIVNELSVGRVVVIHCKGGLGRTGLVAACVLVRLGAPAAGAVAAVRSVREGTIETLRQERFVHEFANVS
jgi:protein-tyrosine phosphatase